MSKTAVIAKITCQEGKRDEAVEIFKGHVEYVNAEAGTLIYALHTDDRDANVIWFYEVYSDGDALKTHSTADAMKALGPKLAAVMAGRPELSFLSPVAAKGI